MKTARGVAWLVLILQAPILGALASEEAKVLEEPPESFPLDSVVKPDANTETPEAAATVANRAESSTKEFKPSRHLGAIEEPRHKVNPFNDVQHVRFDSALGTKKDRNSLEEYARPRGKVKFQDEPSVYVLESPAAHPQGTSKQEESAYVSADEQDAKIHVPLEQQQQQVTLDPSIYQSIDTPLYNPATTPVLYGHPTALQGPSAVPMEPQANYDNTGTPHLPLPVGYYNVDHNFYPVKYSPAPFENPYKTFRQPDNTVLYLHQQSYTRTRKFPYQFYHPSFEHAPADFYGGSQYYLPHQERRISPWKKIIHLIGTFLPLGLLLATLTPTVVQVENTTQPNIVLSKLRVVDLPAEHKRVGRLDDVDESTANICEDRSVCEMILAGGKPQSSLVQNVLWNLATRAPEEAAIKNGLREVFEAVKKKDCSLIDC